MGPRLRLWGSYCWISSATMARTSFGKKKYAVFLFGGCDVWCLVKIEHVLHIVFLVGFFFGFFSLGFVLCFRDFLGCLTGQSSQGLGTSFLFSPQLSLGFLRFSSALF